MHPMMPMDSIELVEKVEMEIGLGLEFHGKRNALSNIEQCYVYGSMEKIKVASI